MILALGPVPYHHVDVGVMLASTSMVIASISIGVRQYIEKSSRKFI